jgi:hypothetical protein
MATKPLTTYPDAPLRRHLEDISEADHDRPLSKVAEMAMQAFVVLFERDKYEALRLVDAYQQLADQRTAVGR